MKTKLILNPRAGDDAAIDRLMAMNTALRRRTGDLDVVVTIGEHDATRQAARAVAEGYDHLFVAGGDGTLNEVVNGVAQAPDGLERVTFGVIPAGTGNDFATACGLPDDPEAAIERLFDAPPASIDVGVLTVDDGGPPHCFVNVSAGGFMAEVSEAVDPRLKTLTGKLAYLIGGAQVLGTYEPVGVRLMRPGAPDTSLDLYTFAVCNSSLVGGGRLIAPHAILDDGLLDVCLIGAMPTVEFVRLLTRVSAGDHVSDDRVTYFRTAEIELEFGRRINVNTDGQVLQTARCRYALRPRAARFLAAGAHALVET